jgi:transcriptional/translational regulatory protein YebC/TACO1
VILQGKLEEEILLEASMEGGADNYEILDDEDNPGAEIFTEVSNLENLNQTLQTEGLTVKEIELRWIPNNSIEVTDIEQARSLLKLIDTLESLDDVQNVTANWEMDEELIATSMV